KLRPAGGWISLSVDGRPAADQKRRRRHAVNLGLVEHAVAVTVEKLEDAVDVVVPRGAERLAVHAHVSANEQRPALGEQDQILGILVGRLCQTRRQGDKETGRQKPENSIHDSTSLIGLASVSTSRMGRPTFDWFCFGMSGPSDVHTVPRRSGTDTGRSLTSMPSGPVLPMTCPPLIPPPARTVDHELAQWSRPLLPLIRGVRPNSPIQTIVVVSSSP